MDKRYELLKLYYDSSKTWYFSILVIAMSFAIASFSIEGFFNIRGIKPTLIFILFAMASWGIYHYKDYKALKNYLN